MIAGPQMQMHSGDYQDPNYTLTQKDPINGTFVGLAIFVAVLLIGMTITTNIVGAKLTYDRLLGPRTIAGRYYSPVSGMMWQLRCFSKAFPACRTQPSRARVQAILGSENALLGFICLGGGMLALIGSGMMARREKKRPRTHGDARWATWPELLASGLVAGYKRKGTPQAEKPPIGIYLGKIKGPGGTYKYLRTADNQPRGALVLGPPNAGKSSCYFVPALLTWPDSAFVYDPSGELTALTAGARKEVLRNRILIFAPTRRDISCHINFVDAVKWQSEREVSTLQNFVKLILDPADKAAEGQEAHWIVTGSTLLECTLAFLHYYSPSKCNLQGAYNFLCDPRFEDSDDPKSKDTGVDRALKFMANTILNSDGQYDHLDVFKDDDGFATPFHQYLTRSAIDVVRKAPNEKSGVVSTTTRFLQAYRDPILGELTRYSDFDWDQLMNHESPVTLYFCIPPSDVQRLRVIVRLALNLCTFSHMGDDALQYIDGKPKFRFKHRLGLFVDEFAQLKKQEQFMLQLSMVRKYGILPFLGAQDIAQIWAAYGGPNEESITSVMAYRIFLRPNKPETAEWISHKILGKTTAESYVRSYSGSRVGFQANATTSTTYNAVDLMSPNAIQDLPERWAIIKAADLRPFKCETLHFESDPEMKRRSEIVPPTRSDALLERRPNTDRSPAFDKPPVVDDKVPSAEELLVKDLGLVAVGSVAESAVATGAYGSISSPGADTAASPLDDVEVLGAYDVAGVTSAETWVDHPAGEYNDGSTDDYTADDF